MYIKNYGFLFATLLIILSCSGNGEDEIPEHLASLENLEVFEFSENPAHPVSFNREISYEETEDVIIGRINGIATDNRGNLYIADDEQKTIHLFDKGGTYIQSIGEEGKGPGEFMGITSLNIKPPYLYAHDYRQNRLNLFDLETRTFKKAIKLQAENSTIELPPRFNPSGYNILPNSDTLLISFTQSFSMDKINKERNTFYYKMNLEGSYLPKRVLKTKSAEFLADRSGNSFVVMYSPFVRQPFLDVGSNGVIYTAWSEDFIIYRYNQSGKQMGAWYYSNFQKTPLTLEEALSLREDNKTYERIVKNMDLPETWPAFDKLLVDDQNRLWIATIVEDKDVYTWRVMDHNGNPLTSFTWPRSRSIEIIEKDKVYVKETEDSGLSKIVQYGFEGI